MIFKKKKELWQALKHEGPHQHHDMQICHLVNSGFTQNEDGACGVQAPPACSARHLNVLT